MRFHFCFKVKHFYAIRPFAIYVATIYSTGLVHSSINVISERVKGNLIVSNEVPISIPTPVSSLVWSDRIKTEKSCVATQDY